MICVAVILLVLMLPCVPALAAQDQPAQEATKRITAVEGRLEKVDEALKKVDEALKALDSAGLLRKLDDRLVAIDRKLPDASAWPGRLEAITTGVRTTANFTLLALVVAVLVGVVSLCIAHGQQKRMSDATRELASMVRAAIDRKMPPIVLGVDPARGPTAGGTAVTIRGKNFEPGAAVRFDGTVAPNAVVTSSELIQVATPAMTEAGPREVSVQNRDGGAGTLARAFAYSPAPIVAGIAPPSAAPAGGTLIIVFGRNFDQDSRILFGGNVVPTTLGSPNHLTFNLPQGAANQAVAVEVRNGDQQTSQWGGTFTYGP